MPGTTTSPASAPRGLSLGTAPRTRDNKGGPVVLLVARRCPVMRYAAVAGLVVLLALICAVPPKAAAPAAEDPLADRVRNAIERGVKYLRDQEDGHGNLEKAALLGHYSGGMTALGALALLTAGVPPDDPLVQRCLKYLRTLDPDRGGQTYVVSLQTMVFAAAGQNEDKERIQRNVDWLISAPCSGPIKGGRPLTGWTYNKGGGVPDNSNTQYALLGLHEGFAAGAKVDPEVWEAIRDFYVRTQYKQGADRGGWHYRSGGGATLTMTSAGVCGLLIAEMDLKASKQKGEPECAGDHCGGDEQSENVTWALEWIGRRLPKKAADVHSMQHLYYSMYGVERVGRFSGERFIGENDWYRVGCEYLVDHQKADGSWTGQDIEGVPVLGTSFALLFLSKG